MAVKRIVTNIATESVGEVQEFYSELFGLEVSMDFDWIVTLSSSEISPVQISIASEGGSGNQVPDISIEVDDVDAMYHRAKKLGHEIKYGLVEEPWGVRRFYLLDPAGKLLNVLAHTES